MAADLNGLRVAIVTDISPGERSRYWIEALAALGELGVESHLVTVREPGVLHEEARDVTSGRLALGARRAKNYPAAAWRLRTYAAAQDLAVIHASEPIPGLIGAMARGAGHGAPSLLFQRRHEITTSKQDWFTSIAAARADRVLTVSRAVTRAVLAAHVRPEKLREVGNGVVATSQRASGTGADERQHLAINEEDVVVMCVARIRAGKGHEVLIEACRLLGADPMLAGRRLHLLLVGDGPKTAAVARRAEETTGFETHLAGWVDDPEDWLAIADVAVVPSLHEAFGKTAVEAMATGTPLVASRVGGLIDLLDGDRNGIGFEPGDAGELASAILKTLSDSPATAARVAAARSAYEREYTIQAMVERWAGVYAEFLSR